MAVLTPARDAMALLRRWPQQGDELSTPDIIALAGGIDHAVVYRWMMRMSCYGYFSRDNRSQPRGGKLVVWSITKKGREAAHELKRVPA